MLVLVSVLSRNRRQTKTLVQIIVFENFIYEYYIYIIFPPFFLQFLLSPPYTPFQIQGLFFLSYFCCTCRVLFVLLLHICFRAKILIHTQAFFWLLSEFLNLLSLGVEETFKDHSKHRRCQVRKPGANRLCSSMCSLPFTPQVSLYV